MCVTRFRWWSGQFGGTVSLFVLLFGLTAAVMARMDSLPTALFAGMFVGIVDRIAIFSSNRASIAIAVMVPVVLIALLLQRKQMSRAFANEATSWSLAREYRAIPSELRDLPEVRWGRLGVFALVGAAALLFPYLVGNVESGLATRMLVFAIVGVSLVILTGWAGQISLGQFGLAGIGAAAGGGLAANHNVDFFVVMLLAGLAGALAAVLIGLPALRIQGLFLAVTTLAFALTVEAFVLHREFFGWLLPDPGRFVEPPALWGKLDLGSSQEVSVLGAYHFDVGNEQKLYYVGLVLLVAVGLCARSLRRLRTGRVLIGTRDNSRVVQAFGISPSSARLVAFALSGFIAGLGGMLLAYQQASVDQATFGANESVKALVMVVIGGIGSLPGAVLGVVFVLGVPLLPGLRSVDQIDTLVSGFGVLAVLLVFPGGLSQLVYGQRDTFLRWVAARRGIHVPSLVADSLVDDAEAPTIDFADLRLDGVEVAAAIALVACPVCDARLPEDEVDAHRHASAMRVSAG
jgi:branched-chain amino acid transport system permease protein